MSSYLTSSVAAATYLSISNASTTYATKVEISNQINMNARLNLQANIIVSTMHLSFLDGLYEYYMVTSPNNLNIYLPPILYDSECGIKLTFRRGYTNNSLNIIAFYSDGVGQYVYNTLNQPGSSMGIGQFTI